MTDLAFVRGQEQREGSGEGLCIAFQKTKLVLSKGLFRGYKFSMAPFVT